MISKIHPRFPWYEIHQDGRVFRVKLNPASKICNANRLGEVKGRILKGSGYRQFKLVDAGGTRVLVRANRLVCETFHGPAPSPLHEAAHNNGVRLDNRADNLRWDTHEGNELDKVKHGTIKRGEAMPHALFTNEQVAEIRSSYRGARGEKRDLARRYRVTEGAIGKLLRGETYAGIGPDRSQIKLARPSAAQRAHIVGVYLTQGYQAALPLALACGIKGKYIAELARQRGVRDNHRRGRGLIDGALERRA